MLTLSLDEYGDFERIGGKKGPVFIAGLIYDDHDDAKDNGIERNRIRQYYRAVISDAEKNAQREAEEARIEDGDAAPEEGASPEAPRSFAGAFAYPQALHSDGDRERDHFVVRHVKEQVKKTISEFIRKGTYQGEKLRWTDRQGVIRDFIERKGSYHLFAILKSDRGLRRLLGKNAGTFARDDYGSNLYFHMADVLISRLLFYNPVIPETGSVTLDIATKTSPSFSEDDPLVRQYRNLRYDPKQSEDGSGTVYFKLTNADIYRTVIAEEILDAEQPELDIASFNVRSIVYSEDDEKKKREFLYLADSVCGLFGFRNEGEGADDWLRHITACAQELTGRKDNLIFGYDEIDLVYTKALQKLKDGDYYQVLSLIHDAGKSEGAFAEHYRSLWFSRLEERVLESNDPAAFRIAVQKLADSLLGNKLETEKCFYILKVLEQMAEKSMSPSRTAVAGKTLYMLYDTGMTAHIHIGDGKNAERFLEKCTKAAHFVSLEDYLNSRNKMVGYDILSFAFERARELADENVMYQELVTELKQEVRLPGLAGEGSIALGKTLSQRAQVLAYLRDGQAAAEFRRALTMFEAGSGNYKITQSYLLHHLIDTGDKEAYLPEAADYFGGKEKPAEQLEYILQAGAGETDVINAKYAFYVFLRGLYTFRRTEITSALRKELYKFEERFAVRTKDEGWRLAGHPSELVFKYLRLIALAADDAETASLFAERMKSCMSYRGDTEEAVLLFAEAECMEAAGEKASAEERLLELYAFLTERFEVFREEDARDDAARIRRVRDAMSFMYR